MQEVNIKSAGIISNKLNSINYRYIKIKDGEKIFFTKAIVLLCNLKAGEYIHFLNEGKDWMFYVSDNKDGFRITSDSNGLLQINSYPLSRMILKSCGYQLKHTFYVKKTNIIHDKCDVFKLTTDKLEK